MKFSGHETFQVREGWLHKGMKLIHHDPQMIGDEFVSDHLGVGRNMAKSIRHWLVATKLAEPVVKNASSKWPTLKFTEIGELVWERDPYFLELGTWWMLHINLVNSPRIATTWAWFFNSFGHNRFGRSVCLESLQRYVAMSQTRPPSAATLERDLSCLLLSYSRTIPVQNIDPEEGTESPFRELGLLNYFKNSGYYQLNQTMKNIPSAIFGYAMANAFEELQQNRKDTDISLGEITRKTGGPGRVFCLSEESLFETISRIESVEQQEFSVSNLAGEKAIRIRCRSAVEWATRYYHTITEEACVT